MKSKMIVLALVALMAVPAFAAGGDHRQPAAAGGGQGIVGGGSDGCGLGWQVTDKRTMIGTTTRGTTNAVIPPTFGMTSGTIGCEQHQFAKNEMNAVNYVASNTEALSVEMAQGSGEYVTGLALEMGCSATQIPAFGQALQNNFEAIVPASANGAQMYKNVRNMIRNDAALSQSCGV